MTDAGDVLPDLRGRLYPRMANVLSKQLGLSRALPLIRRWSAPASCSTCAWQRA